MKEVVSEKRIVEEAVYLLPVSKVNCGAKEANGKRAFSFTVFAFDRNDAALLPGEYARNTLSFHPCMKLEVSAEGAPSADGRIFCVNTAWTERDVFQLLPEAERDASAPDF